jgi:hypothetical protein
MATRRIDGCSPLSHLRVIAVVALLVLSACAPHASPAGGNTDEPGPSTGITLFGDARLGVAF